MNLIYLLEDLDRTFLGTNVGMISRFFCDIGWNVSILTNTTDSNDEITEFSPGIAVVHVDRKKEFVKWLLANRNSYDCVLSYNTRSYNIVLPLLSLLYGKMVLIKTDRLIGINFGSLRSAARSLLVVVLPLMVSKLVLVESPSISRQIAKYLNSERICLLPNCVNTPLLQRLEQGFSTSDAAADRKSILYVGRISPEKGIDILLTGFSLALREMPDCDWMVRIVGPVSDADHNAQLQGLVAELGLGGRVEFAGAYYGEALYQWYAKSDIFCLPSRSEGMPNVIPDAMYFKKAIVAADVGEVSYQLDGGNCGRLFEKENAVQLSRCLKDFMLDGNLREAFGQRARDRVTTEFDHKNVYRVLQSKLTYRG